MAATAPRDSAPAMRPETTTPLRAGASGPHQDWPSRNIHTMHSQSLQKKKGQPANSDGRLATRAEGTDPHAGHGDWLLGSQRVPKGSPRSHTPQATAHGTVWAHGVTVHQRRGNATRVSLSVTEAWPEEAQHSATKPDSPGAYAASGALGKELCKELLWKNQHTDAPGSPTR